MDFKMKLILKKKKILITDTIGEPYRIPANFKVFEIGILNYSLSF